MSSLDKEPGLTSIVASLRGDATFLAGWLSATPYGLKTIAARLKLDEPRMMELLLCRAPRPQDFAHDVAEIASYIHVNPTDLAAALREAGSLAALTGSSAESMRTHPSQRANTSTLLAAARDTVMENILIGEDHGVLRKLADSVWASAPREIRESLDVDAVIAWCAPLAIVSLPRLTLRSADAWLASQTVAFRLNQPDRPLRGLLLAWRGNGFVLIDGTLSKAEHRLTLAHEFGHFLLDYRAVRERVVKRAPELLEVLDGYRAPTYDDRALAAVQQVSLGVHTHLVDRSQYEDLAWDAAALEDRATRFALELLCPWEPVLELLRAHVNLIGSEPHDYKLRMAVHFIEREFAIPAGAARVRAKAALMALGVRPGFFER